MRSIIKLIKKGPNAREVDRRSLLIIGLILAGIVAGISLIALCWFPDSLIPPGDNGGGDGGDPSGSFGNATLNGEFVADAKVLTVGGDEGGSGTVKAMAGPPDVVFSDDFETGDLSKWSSSTDHIAATSAKSYEGTYSCEFDNPGNWGRETLRKNDAFDVEGDEELHMYFALYINGQFDMEPGEIHSSHNHIRDYFVVKLKFDNGNTLVYLLGGMYSAGSKERVIDVSSQVTAQDEWVGIAIEDIQNDYEAQFGDEMDDEGDIKIQLRSRDGTVWIDAFKLKKTPFSNEGNYWTYNDEPLECYFVDVDFKIVISDEINETTVGAEIKLWVTIEYDGEVAKDKTFLQEALINVTVFDEWINWTSICFAFPADDAAYGSPLTYIFDVSVEAWGQIEDGYPGAGNWTSDEATKDGFDSFTVHWVSYEGYLYVVIATVGGGATVGVVGARKARKKRRDPCACAGKPDCECSL